MSGPIVRKYGFPNFDKIFGEQKPKHGVEDAPASDSKAKPGESAEARAAGAPRPEAEPEKK